MALTLLISDGSFPAGSFLPAVSELASNQAVSLSTAKRAVALLREQGLVTLFGRNRLRIVGS